MGLHRCAGAENRTKTSAGYGLLTIEITKVDGSVEVVNKYVAKAANEVKGKALVFADQIKTKIKEVKEDASDNARYKENVYKDDETVYSYTVNFDEEKEEK